MRNYNLPLALVLGVLVSARLGLAASEVVIGYANISARVSPLWIAQEKGFFAKYGVNAQQVYMPGSPVLIASMSSGQVHLANSGGTAALGAAAGGVDLRVIGRVEKGHGLEAEPFPGKRQHLRCIVRDGRAAFVGSQSLRKPELDARREIGVIAKDARLVRAITQVFEEDWARTEAGRKEARKREEASRKGNGRHEAGRQRGSGEESDKSDKRAAAAASA